VRRLALGHTCTEEGLWEGLRWGMFAGRRYRARTCAEAHLHRGGSVRALALGHVCREEVSSEGLRWDTLALLRRGCGRACK
jgi:hypothetical protein